MNNSFCPNIDLDIYFIRLTIFKKYLIQKLNKFLPHLTNPLGGETSIAESGVGVEKRILPELGVRVEKYMLDSRLPVLHKNLIKM